jgi:hypothetical protein
MGALPAAHLHPHCPWSLPSRPVSGASRDTDAPTFLDFQFRLKITPGLCDSVRRSDERQGRPGAQEIYGQESPTCVPTLVLPPLRLVSSAGWGPSGAGVPRWHRTGLRKFCVRREPRMLGAPCGDRKQERRVVESLGLYVGRLWRGCDVHALCHGVLCAVALTLWPEECLSLRKRCRRGERARAPLRDETRGQRQSAHKAKAYTSIVLTFLRVQSSSTPTEVSRACCAGMINS